MNNSRHKKPSTMKIQVSKNQVYFTNKNYVNKDVDQTSYPKHY